MSNMPTGKLKYAYQTITNMERKISELKEQLEHLSLLSQLAQIRRRQTSVFLSFVVASFAL